MEDSCKVIALVSGGLDSLVLIHTLLQRGWWVYPVYVRCGLVWEPAERRAAHRWLATLRQKRLQPVQIIPLPLQSVYREHWSVSGRGRPSARSSDAAVYLPGRNLLLMSVAAVYGAGHGASTLALGTLAGNPFRDATPAFFSALARCQSRALSRTIRILTPLRRFTKAQMIARSPTLPYALTMSCLAPQSGRHCGRCNKCAERQRAFRAARVPDSTRYEPA